MLRISAFALLILMMTVGMAPFTHADEINRVLLVGDSWAEMMWWHRSLKHTFAENGYPQYVEKGDLTAIAGTYASWWARPAQLNLITSELNANPEIDVVHLVMGGNDVLGGIGGGGWHAGMTPAAEQALFDELEGYYRTVIDHVLAHDPRMHVVLCIYDYPNLHDPAQQEPLGQCAMMLANLLFPTVYRLNDALIRGLQQLMVMADTYDRVHYVNNLGLMQYNYGYPGAFPPFTVPPPIGNVPGGDPNYPTPQEALNNSGMDCIHLDGQGYRLVGQNCFDRIYGTLFAGGEPTVTPAVSATPALETPTPVQTATSLPTASPTPTLTPTNTPVTGPPTATPASDTPTPEPAECENSGVDIWMPAENYSPGDLCACVATVCNADSTPIQGAPLFVVLDVFGTYYFGPGFTPSVNNYLAGYPAFDPGATTIEVFPEFAWPGGAGQASGIRIYGALTDAGMTRLIGEMGSFTFGWGG